MIFGLIIFFKETKKYDIIDILEIYEDIFGKQFNVGYFWE